MSVTRRVTQRVTQPVTLPVTIGAPTSALPIPLTAPVITGTTFVGDMLTVTPGTYINATTVTGEWYVDGVATGVTNLTYVVDVDDAGLLIEWREDVSNSYGSTQQTASVTAATLLANVQHLYANGEQGALYYFTEDFAGLYQDDYGTTPVTAVGQPVGLMLDRRFGLARGPELNPDVDIDNPDAWSLGDGWSIVDGALVANLPTGNAIVIGTAPEVGKTYEITFEVVEYTSGSVRIGGGTGSGLTRTGAGVFSEIRTGTSTTPFRFLSAGSPVLKIGRFSIREIPGNHASQPTTTARPLLQRDGNGKLERRFDAVDDVMNTTFPALGSSVTIGRAIPGVGAQILTGQTINAGVWADNVSSNSTAIIDRALTPNETSTLTAWLNQQSGV